ncbi:MAG: DUF885 family protein [Pseudomonadota bacterium]
MTVIFASPALAAEVDSAPLAAAVASYELAIDGSEDEAETAANKWTLPDSSPAAEAKRLAAYKAVRAKLSAIDPKALSAKDRLTWDLLAWALDGKIEAAGYDETRMPFSSDGGFDMGLLYRADGAKLANEADARRWIALLGQIPAYYDTGVANARRGIATGFVQPVPTAEGVLARARKAAAMPLATDPLLDPLRKLPKSIPEDRRAALLKVGEAAIAAKVTPARKAFAAFMADEYLPKASKSLAASDLPGGPAYYAFLVRYHTTTDLTPDQVHELGVKEVARIRAEMEVAKADAGFTGTMAEFRAFLRTDDRFYATSRQQLLEKASEIAKRVDDQLPAHFKTLPRLSYGVRPVPTSIEEGYTTGRYFDGDPQAGRAGGLMINTSSLRERPLYELPALVLHEGAPGHHIQIALAQEQVDVPAFRRELYVTTFGEGWGLYSEKLGVEMGIYRDPYEQFGRLSYEMWRACRLVADTGIHARRWTIEQARACFTENSALSPVNIEVELQRYVSWPGQALAYKIGELKLLELRKRAETALGDRFDERAFHDAVLLHGALPLSVLERQIDGWIATRTAAP